MAFNTAEGRAEYIASAGQTVFTFSFKIYQTSDIEVYLTPTGSTPDDTADLLTEATDYNVVINGDLGGTVTLVASATLNDAVTIVRELPTTRSTEYQELGDMYANTLNQDQDYQTYLSADQSVRLDRNISIPKSSQNVSTVLPTPEALKLIRWNVNADAFENINQSADLTKWVETPTVTAGQTVITLTHQTKNASVYINGALLNPYADYTTSGNTVTLVQPIDSSDDEVVLVGGDIFLDPPSTQVVYVPTITAMGSVDPLSTTTVIVQEEGRGGTFNYDASQSAVNNGGTIFDGWVREYDGAVIVDWFGAKADGITNNYNSFLLCSSFIQSNQGGILEFSNNPLGYSITAPSNNGNIFDLSNISNIEIRGNKSYIFFTNTYLAGEGNVLFNFDSCANISITGVRAYNDYIKTSDQKGFTFSRFKDNCNNVNIDKIDLEGCFTAVQTFKDSALGVAFDSYGFNIGRIRTVNGYYGINCQYTGNDFNVENLETDGIHRSYFIYGVKHHTARIRSRNNTAADVAIAGLDGFGCENINIDYINTNSTAPATGNLGTFVNIGLSDGPNILSAPATIRNIKVNITGEVAVNTNAYGFEIVSSDATAIGHTVENVSVTGTINSAWSSFNPVHIARTYPVTGNNTIRNIRLQDLFISGSVADCDINCRDVDFLTVDSFTTPAACIIRDGIATNNILVKNSSATTFGDDIADITSISFENTTMGTGTLQSKKNKRFTTTQIAGDFVNTGGTAWATLDPAGTLIASEGIAGSSKVGIGYYAVDFERTYTVGTFCGVASIAGGTLFCEVIQWSGTQARVRVWNTSGALTDPVNQIMIALFANQ